MKKALLLTFIGILSLGFQTQADRLSDLGFDAKESSVLSSAFSQADFTEFLKVLDINPTTVKGLLSELNISDRSPLLEKNTSENNQLNTLSDTRNQKSDLNSEQITDVREFSNARININPTKTYNYTAINCKTYQINYLTDREVYTSPDFQQPMYFIAPAYIERYIDSKNPGTCIKRDSYDTNQRFSNNSTSRYIAPNGKIYYTKSTTNGRRYSDEMESPIRFNSLATLQQKIFDENSMESIKTSLVSTNLQRTSQEVASFIDTRQSSNDIASSNTLNVRQSNNDIVSSNALDARQSNTNTLNIRQSNDEIISTSLNNPSRTPFTGLCESPTNPRQPKEYTTFASSRYPWCDTNDIKVGKFVIAACNVGASIASPEYYCESAGQKFQRGNNYGRAYDDTPRTSTNQISNPIHPFSSSTFIKEYSDRATPSNSNLRGGNTNDWLTTLPSSLADLEARKWPCAQWYHVPSQWEWNQLLINWANDNNVNLDDANGYKSFSNATAAWKFKNALYLPLAGIRNSWDGELNSPRIHGFYWSSSPNITSSRLFYLDSTNVIASHDNYRSYGFSIRCFKN